MDTLFRVVLRLQFVMFVLQQELSEVNSYPTEYADPGGITVRRHFPMKKSQTSWHFPSRMSQTFLGDFSFRSKTAVKNDQTFPSCVRRSAFPIGKEDRRCEGPRLAGQGELHELILLSLFA